MNTKLNLWKSTSRLLVLMICLLSFSQMAFAQRPGDRQKLESAKIAHITERLSLTPEVAQQFWPVYNQIKEKERELRKQEMEMRRNEANNTMTDAEAEQALNKYFELKEQQLALEKDAAEQYQDVLSPKQVVQLFKAEAEFHRMVLQKFSERRKGGRPPQ